MQELSRLVLSLGLRTVVRNTSTAFRGFGHLDSGLPSVTGAFWPTPSSCLGTVRLLSTNYSDLPLDTGRRRIVILGSGWAAARLAKDISARLYDITIVSPRNHMVFTPLLASTCVGTLEPRSVALPLIDIQKELKQPQVGARMLLTLHAVHGVEQYTHPLRDVKNATDIRSHIIKKMESCQPTKWVAQPC